MIVTAKVEDATLCTFLSQHGPNSSLYPIRTVPCSSGTVRLTISPIVNGSTGMVQIAYAVRARSPGHHPAQAKVAITELGAPKAPTVRPAPSPAPSPAAPVVGLETCNPGPDCDYGPISSRFPSYGNVAPDALGDCTFAAAADWEQIALNRTPDPTLIGFEFAQAGGTTEGLTLDALWNYWTQNGIAGVTLTGTKSYFIDQTDVEDAVRDYGAMIITLEWTNPDGFAQYTVSGGNHVAVVDGFTPLGPLVVSWGQTLQMTWAQWNNEVTGMWGISAS